MSETDVSTGLFHVPPGLCVSARRYQCHLARLSQPWHPANARTFLTFISFFKDFACRDKSCVKWPSAKAGPHYLLSWCWGRLWHKFTWDRCSYFWGHFWGKFTSDRCTPTSECIAEVNSHQTDALPLWGDLQDKFTRDCCCYFWGDCNQINAYKKCLTLQIRTAGKLYRNVEI